jgi:hypothetical protein
MKLAGRFAKPGPGLSVNSGRTCPVIAVLFLKDARQQKSCSANALRACFVLGDRLRIKSVLIRGKPVGAG